MAYRVIRDFADLEDGKHIYRVGDIYPRQGLAPAKERVEFLQSSQNLLQTPVIEPIPGDENGAGDAEQGTAGAEKKVARAGRKKQDAVEAEKTAAEEASDEETKEYKPKRRTRSKTAEKG